MKPLPPTPLIVPELPFQGADSHELVESFLAHSGAPFLKGLDKGLESSDALCLQVSGEESACLVALCEKEGVRIPSQRYAEIRKNNNK